MNRADGTHTSACRAHLALFVSDELAAVLAERGPRPPAPPGSARVPSQRRTARHATTAGRTARVALAQGRPTELVALALYAAARRMAPGRGRLLRSDRAEPMARLAAHALSSADHRSGRGARPGRVASAALLGVCERGISRYWRDLEAFGLATLDTTGRLLTLEERAALVAAGRVEQRAVRAQWTMTVPEWAREVTDAELAPYMEPARRMLAELGPQPTPTRPPGRPAREVTRPPGQGPGRPVERPRWPVAWPNKCHPFPRGVVLGSYVPVRRTKTLRPDGREGHKGAASRPSSERRARPSKVGHFGSGRPLPAYPLARELAGGSLLVLSGLRHDQVCQLAAGLGRRGLAAWTAADVVLHIEQAARAGTPIPAVINYPVSWVLSRLDRADPDAPPDQQRLGALAAAAAAQRDRQAAARAAVAELDAAAVSPAAVPEYVQARADLRRSQLTSPGAAGSPAAASVPPAPGPLRGAALARAELAAALARREAASTTDPARPLPMPEQLPPPPPARSTAVGLAQVRTVAQLRPAGQCVTCGRSGPDVRQRATTTGVPIAACDQHAAWIDGEGSPSIRRPNPANRRHTQHHRTEGTRP